MAPLGSEDYHMAVMVALSLQGHHNSVVKIRTEHQSADLGTEGRARRRCLQGTGAHSLYHLYGSQGCFGMGKMAVQRWARRRWHQEPGLSVKKLYGEGQGHLFARTRRVLCGGVDEVGRMSHGNYRKQLMNGIL